MQQMEQSSHYCSRTGHRTHPLPSAFSIDTHTVRLYCNEVGGETSKKETRTCSGVVIYQPVHTHAHNSYTSMTYAVARHIYIHSSSDR